MDFKDFYDGIDIIKRSEKYVELSKIPWVNLTEGQITTMIACAHAVMDGIASGKYKLVDTEEEMLPPGTLAHEIMGHR